MALKGKKVTLVTYTKEYCHEFYQGYVADPQMTEHTFTYCREKIDQYFDTKSADDTRKLFAIRVNDKIIGEIQLKYIDEVKKEGTLSIILQNDAVKNKGYGTDAEVVLLDYAFNSMNLSKVFADTTERNVTSKHVLNKLGFKHLRDENDMSYFELKSKDWNK